MPNIGTVLHPSGANEKNYSGTADEYTVNIDTTAAWTLGDIVRLTRTSTGTSLNNIANPVAATISTDTMGTIYGVIMETISATAAGNVNVGLRGKFVCLIDEASGTNITGTGHPLIVGHALTSGSSQVGALTSAKDVPQAVGANGLQNHQMIVGIHCSQTALGASAELKEVIFDGINGFGTASGLADTA